MVAYIILYFFIGLLFRSRMHSAHELYVKRLEDEKYHDQHKKEFDTFPISKVARFFGALLIGLLNTLYGSSPTYQKFRAIELVARIPYQTWEMACIGS